MSIRKNQKIGCAFLSRPGDNLTKSFRSGRRAILRKDLIELLSLRNLLQDSGRCKIMSRDNLSKGTIRAGMGSYL